MWIKLENSNRVINLDMMVGFEVLDKKIDAVLPDGSIVNIYEGDNYESVLRAIAPEVIDAQGAEEQIEKIAKDELVGENIFVYDPYTYSEIKQSAAYLPILKWKSEVEFQRVIVRDGKAVGIDNMSSKQTPVSLKKLIEDYSYPSQQ